MLEQFGVWRRIARIVTKECHFAAQNSLFVYCINDYGSAFSEHPHAKMCLWNQKPRRPGYQPPSASLDHHINTISIKHIADFLAFIRSHG